MAVGHPFWRINVTASQAGGNITVGELQFREVAGVSQLPTGGVPAFSIEQGGGFGAANAYDGTSTTAWGAASTIPSWLGYHYAGTNATVQVAITSHATFWTLSPKDFTVDWSDDGTTWTTVATFTGTAWTGASQTQLFTATDSTVVSIESASAVALHSVRGGSSAAAAVDLATMHTVVGASPSESWVSALSMHTVRGGRVDEEAVDMVVMHTVIGPPYVSPTQRITVSVSRRAA